MQPFILNVIGDSRRTIAVDYAAFYSTGDGADWNGRRRGCLRSTGPI
jgi:hypothetical protein